LNLAAEVDAEISVNVGRAGASSEASSTAHAEVVQARQARATDTSGNQNGPREHKQEDHHV
jgi:hypothetical protein